MNGRSTARSAHSRTANAADEIKEQILRSHRGNGEAGITPRGKGHAARGGAVAAPSRGNGQDRAGSLARDNGNGHAGRQNDHEEDALQVPGNGEAQRQAPTDAEEQHWEPGWEADPDVQLMLRARDGDQHAFRELFVKHSEPMLSFACRYIGNRARAEELVQEAFLQIFRARQTYEARARFVTYAYRVVLNLCLNELRRFEYQGKTESLDTNPFEDGGRAREFPDGRTPGCEESVIGGELATRIRQAIDELPDHQKSSLLLTRVEGLSHREVAEILDTSVSAVKSLVFRGMRTLRENLRDVLE